ncbi:MAG: Rossmann-like domain-containing protein [Pseudomonadota bacterium]
MSEFDPHAPYACLLDAVGSSGRADVGVDSVMLGLTWTSCRAGGGFGLAMSPALSTRVLPWPGTLAGRPLGELASWVRAWNPHEATVGLAAANAAINVPGNALMALAEPLERDTDDSASGNLAVFEYFRPRLSGLKVAVIGRYPGLERVLEGLDATVLERAPGEGDLPDPAAEYLLPQADWVFLTSTALINKTFPRLAALSRDAVTVLMGPSTPWLAEWSVFGIDFLAGVRVVDAERAGRVVAEGGGTRLFGEGLHYAVADIGQARMAALKAEIAETYARITALKAEMTAWYGGGNTRRFSGYSDLSALEKRLSRLDSAYTRQWNARHGAGALHGNR